MPVWLPCNKTACNKTEASFSSKTTFQMYVLHILHGHFRLFQFIVFPLKDPRERDFLFSRKRLHVWNPVCTGLFYKFCSGSMIWIYT